MYKASRRLLSRKRYARRLALVKLKKRTHTYPSPPHANTSQSCSSCDFPATTYESTRASTGTHARRSSSTSTHRRILRVSHFCLFLHTSRVVDLVSVLSPTRSGDREHSNTAHVIMSYGCRPNSLCPLALAPGSASLPTRLPPVGRARDAWWLQVAGCVVAKFARTFSKCQQSRRSFLQ